MLSRYHDDDRGSPKRHCHQNDRRELEHQQMLSRIQSRLEELKKQCLDEQPKIYVEPLGKANLDAPSHFAVPLMDTVTEFLDSERKVLLLLGDPGSSKTVFLKRLERRLWEACNGVNDPIPIFIDLPYITNPASDLLGKVLESKNFSQDQRRHLKSSQRQFILLCDGFDEAHVTGNIYYNNDFNGHGQWQAKLVIACRSNKVGRDYRGRFQPEPKNRYDATDLGLFQEAAIAPFTRRQIKDYVTQYVAQERPQLLDRQMSGSGQVAAPRVRSEAQGLPPVVRDWSVDAYMEMLTDIPNLMDVVKNPYVLSFVLRLLPTIAGSASDFSRACVSFDTLYKHFFDDWMEVNKRRLHTMHMSDSEHQAHGELIDSDFTASSMDYLKDLAVEILRRQGGDPVIQYSDFKERDTWKARFLGSESRTKVLRESVPIVRSGSSYRLVHDSMIDYLYSLVVFDADHKSDPSNIGGGGPLTLSTQEMSEDTKRKGTLELISISERPMTVQFLADRAQNSEPFRSWLIEMVGESRNNVGDHQTLAANAMTILVRSRMRFNSANLQGIKIRGANLTGGEFDSADFQGADLSGVIFEKCWLRRARLDGARLEGARFGELRAVDLRGMPRASAYSRDGSFYAVGLDDGSGVASHYGPQDGSKGASVTVFSTNDWSSAYHLQDFRRRITAVAFSADGELLAIGDEDGWLRICEYKRNITTMHKSFRAHRDYISAMAYPPDGCRIVTASRSGEIGVWDPTSSQLIHLLDGHNGETSSVAFSPDGSLLVSGGSDNAIRLWDSTTGDAIFVLKGHEGAISAVLFSPDGRHIASASSDKTVRIWSTTARSSVVVLHGHTRGITGIAYSANGKRLFSCSDDSTIRSWDPCNGSSGPVIARHTTEVMSVACSQDGEQIISCGRDKLLLTTVAEAVLFGRTNEISSGMYPFSVVGRNKTIRPTLPRPPWMCTFTSEPVSCNVNGVAFSPDGVLTASAGADGSVRLWIRATNAPSHVLAAHSDQVSNIAFSPDNQHIVSGCYDGQVRLWRVQSGELVRVLEGHKDKVTSVAYSPSGHHIVSGSEDGTVRLWDASTGEGKCVFEGHEDAVLSVAFSPCGGWVASASGDETVRLWSAVNGEPGAVFEGHEASVNSVAFSPDGKHLASASDDRTVMIWDVKSGDLKRDFKGHAGLVKCLAYSPSGHHIASGDDEETVLIWDIQTGTINAVLGHTGCVLGVAYSSDGRQLMTGAMDFRFRFWMCAPGGQDTALVSTVGVSRDCRQVASSLGGNTVQLWDTKSGRSGPILESHSGTIECLSYSHTDDNIATGSIDGTIRIWDSQTGQCFSAWRGHADGVANVVFSPNGTQIVSVDAEPSLRVWKLSVSEKRSSLEVNNMRCLSLVDQQQSALSVNEHMDTQTDEDMVLGQKGQGAKVEFEHRDHSGFVTAPVFSPDGTEIAVGNGDYEILRFVAQSGTPLDPLRGHSGIATCIAYSPGSDMIATSSEDKTTRIWDSRTAQSLLVLECPNDINTGIVTSVAFAPFGDQLATSHADGSIRLWRVTDGNPGSVLVGHTRSVFCVAYSPDGKFIVSGSEDRTIHLWDAFSGQHLAVVRDFIVGVKTVQWRATQDRLLLVTGCKENPLRVWQVVEGDDGYDMRACLGAGPDVLAASDAVIGRNQGLDEADITLFQQRGASLVGAR